MSYALHLDLITMSIFCPRRGTGIFLFFVFFYTPAAKRCFIRRLAGGRHVALTVMER